MIVGESAVELQRLFQQLEVGLLKYVAQQSGLRVPKAVSTIDIIPRSLISLLYCMRSAVL